MAYIECVEPSNSAPKNVNHCKNSASTALPVSASQTSSCSFMRLAPELRNVIYDILFESPQCFFVRAVEGTYPKLCLRESSGQPQYDALQLLQTLGLVSQGIRFEARTRFYASKHFFVLPYGFEYLPIFVHWLEAIGPECQAVLRKACFAGYIWHQPSMVLTKRFQSLLQNCANLRLLTVQISVRHLCESCLPDLDAYFDFDGPLPDIDITAWAETIAHLPELKDVRLDLIMSRDRAWTPLQEELMYMYFMDDRGKKLVEDLERRLRGRVDELRPGKDIDMTVRYAGTHNRMYYGRMW
jgi:hypothetical protein